MDLTKHYYLTSDEITILRKLSEDKSFSSIRRVMGITAQQFATLLAKLRLKTGIVSSKDPQAHKDYLAAFEAAPGATEIQVRLLNRFAHGDALKVSKILLRPVEALQQEYRAALKDIGIFTPSEREQRVQVRLFLATRKMVRNPIPLYDEELAVLGQYAQGMRPAQIPAILGLTQLQVDTCLQEGLRKLGCVARGRGVQQRLVANALKYQPLDTPESRSKPPTMDDPLF